jgi:iron(III) transport system substrate-binding protein
MAAHSLIGERDPRARRGGSSRGRALAGLVGLVAALLGCAAPPASPAAAPPASQPAASQPAGAAPSQASELEALEQAARREGRLVIYATGADNMDKLIAAFMRKYPEIKTEAVRLRGPELVARVDTEFASGQRVASLMATGLNSTLTLRNHGRLLPWMPPAAAEFGGQYHDPQGMFWSTHLNVYSVLVNTNLVPADGRPREWRDLADPRWKDRILADDPRTQGGGQVMMIAFTKAPEFGWAFVESLKGILAFTRQNNEAPRQLARGEYAIFVPAQVNNETARLVRTAPVAVVPIEPAVGIPIHAAVLADAPHPNAAKLFGSYLLSEEGQRILSLEEGQFALRPDIPPPDDFPDIRVDRMRFLPLVTEEDRLKNDEYVARFEQIFFR